ncbi:peptidoglycan-binding domain-containing protein, partial [Vulcaniibacterium gelatinicum]|uniref:peptidoglycan-binding domain-containing protein n=1 Tax=Vulcaniibacterium gelatinicum TaxID=2598725 RepID=UPI0011C84B73
MVKDKESALMELEQWRLGRTSERYESGGRGPGVISTGRGDHGGVSYGTYQLSTKTGTLREYLSQSKYAHRFAGLQPSTPEFDAVWRELARTDPGFAQDQHDFIGRTHYERQRQRLKATGIDLDGRGRSVHDALWSTAVQFRNLTPTIFRKGIEERFGQGRDLSSLSDRDIVEAVQDYKIAHNERLFRSSPSWWPGLLKRAHAEKVDLLRLATLEEIAGMRNAEALNSALVEPSFSGRPLRQGDRGQVVRRLQESLNEIGVTSTAGNPLREDGHFGPRTREAVEAFQRAQGLRVDGVVGRETLAALRAAESRLAQAAPPAAQTPGAADFRDPA